jgi:hypothetical protein
MEAKLLANNFCKSLPEYTKHTSLSQILNYTTAKTETKAWREKIEFILVIRWSKAHQANSIYEKLLLLFPCLYTFSFLTTKGIFSLHGCWH